MYNSYICAKNQTRQPSYSEVQLISSDQLRTMCQKTEPQTTPCQFEVDLQYDYDSQKWFPGGHTTEEVNWAFGYPDTDDVMILKMTDSLYAEGSRK